MTSVPHTNRIAPLRLTLKAVAPTTGYVDGAWWPRSRDLGAEASDLARAVTLRVGPVREIAYARDAWEAAPRHVTIDPAGGTPPVRLVGFASQDPHVVLVTGESGRTLGLLVVPPESPEQAGRDAVRRAARPGNAESPSALLAAAGARAPVAMTGRRRPLRRSGNGTRRRRSGC